MRIVGLGEKLDYTGLIACSRGDPSGGIVFDELTIEWPVKLGTAQAGRIPSALSSLLFAWFDISLFLQ